MLMSIILGLSNAISKGGEQRVEQVNPSWCHYLAPAPPCGIF